MAKGDDAVRRKKNKINRKRMRNSESSVSVRIASIIASKRRRQAGKRRICEGMCFSLPTPDDPFNDNKPLSAKKPLPEKKKKKKKKMMNKKKPNIGRRDTKNEDGDGKQIVAKDPGAADASSEEGCPSKFLILCLNAIQNSWEEEEGAYGLAADRPLLASNWGIEFWRCSLGGSNMLGTSGDFASREQVAWLVSLASDTIARKEKHGLILSTPFLLYLVPSQEKAVQVRSVCKALKAFGVHTVSLHPGAPLDHQIRGLKSCEPEFLVSTPERLLELVSLEAIDISGTSLLVIDGLRSFVEFGFVDKLTSIKESISGSPQTVVFSDCLEDGCRAAVDKFLHGPTHRLSVQESG